MSPWLRVRVRLDRLVALAALLVAGPVIALGAARVRGHDRGPGLIRVERVGRHGVPFGMWKIRTMRAERPDGTAGGVPLTGGDDQRVTPVGRRLRRWHLDELPQLLNVVAGQMALLGPRPEAPEFVDLTDPAWARVLQVPPGIAGATQLVVGDWERAVIAASPDGSGYRDRALPLKLDLDGWYVRHASPVVDVQIGVALLRHLAGRDRLGRLGRRLQGSVPALATAGIAPAGAS